MNGAHDLGALSLAAHHPCRQGERVAGPANVQDLPASPQFQSDATDPIPTQRTVPDDAETSFVALGRWW